MTYRALARNKNIPEDIAIKLAKVDDHLTQIYLMSDFESLSEQVLNAILSNKNANVVESLLSKDKTGKISNEILIKLANSEDANIRKALGYKNNLPKYIFEKLLNDENPEVVATMLEKEQATEEQLRKFSTSKNIKILEAIANNQKTPADILGALSTSKNSDVRSAVAMNQNTPVDVTIKLAEDPSKKVRYHLLVKNNLDDKVLEILMHDHDKGNRENAEREYNKRKGITK